MSHLGSLSIMSLDWGQMVLIHIQYDDRQGPWSPGQLSGEPGARACSPGGWAGLSPVLVPVTQVLQALVEQ